MCRARESEVRSYSRMWPTHFVSARDARLFASDGQVYLDFFAGAGALNYGHNNQHLQRDLLDYISRNGIVHSLDMNTSAKDEFLEEFGATVLGPRGLDYRVQFCGPTGTNSVEAALKLARKVTGRPDIVAFSRGFHGMSLGSLAATGNGAKRRGGGVPLNHIIRLPFEKAADGVDELGLLRYLITEPSSGVDLPAAVILETVQAEGGVHPASAEWLRRLAALCRDHGVLLIVDDVQMGCGRAGGFFSWEFAGIRPDLVCLSKSLSGYGLPMAVTLMRPDLDIWSPGEHNGTFRGHNLAFVTARATLERYWRDEILADQVRAHGQMVSRRLRHLKDAYPWAIRQVRGRGLVWGLEFAHPQSASTVSRLAFETERLIVETAGSQDQVVKLLPPLTVSEEQLRDGLDRLTRAVEAAVDHGAVDRTPPAVAVTSG